MPAVTSLSNPVRQDLVDKLFFARESSRRFCAKKALFHVPRSLLLSADDTDECLPSPAKLPDARYSPRENRIHKGHLMFPPCTLWRCKVIRTSGIFDITSLARCSVSIHYNYIRRMGTHEGRCKTHCRDGVENEKGWARGEGGGRRKINSSQQPWLLQLTMTEWKISVG